MYKDILKEIEEKKILEINIEHLKQKIEFTIENRLGIKASSISEVKIMLIGKQEDKFAQTFAEIEEYEKEKKYLNGKYDLIEDHLIRISEEISKLKNIEAKVFKCRYLDGLTEQQTANRLGYSIQRIKQICKKIKD